jgi:hypothetical protein
MPKKERIDEFKPKVIQNIAEKLEKLNDDINNFKDIPKIIQNLNEKTIKLENKFKSNEISPKDFQNLVDKITQCENELLYIKNQITIDQQKMHETVNTQEEIIMDMINKFNEEFLNHKSEVLKNLEQIKSQQDILKISFTLNEKKLMEKIESMINKGVKHRIQGKESEILMKIWIDEFKAIIENFDKLKEVQPKEFSIKLNEISNTIDIFRQKLQES